MLHKAVEGILGIPLKDLNEKEFMTVSIQAAVSGVRISRFSSYSYEEIIAKRKRFLRDL